MNSRASIAGAWAGGGLVTLLLAVGAPLALWATLLLLLILAAALSG
jgi:hypothetical protein